eukprot:2765838-Rhodomonas_salina.2
MEGQSRNTPVSRPRPPAPNLLPLPAPLRAAPCRSFCCPRRSSSSSLLSSRFLPFLRALDLCLNPAVVNPLEPGFITPFSGASAVGAVGQKHTSRAGEALHPFATLCLASVTSV